MPATFLVAADSTAAGFGSVNGEILEYLKVISLLAGVVAIAFIALRFWLPKLTAGSASTSGPLRVEWRLSLEPRKTLYIVRAGSDYVLLAASEAGVQFLVLLDSGAIDTALQNRSRRQDGGFEFASLLRPRRRSHPGEGVE